MNSHIINLEHKTSEFLHIEYIYKSAEISHSPSLTKNSLHLIMLDCILMLQVPYCIVNTSSTLSTRCEVTPAM